MINYIIQVLLFQISFVLVYDLLLSKETFFSKNRWYLLSTAIISFVLPLIKLPSVKKAVPLEYTIMLPEVVLSPQNVIEKSSWYQSINYLDVLFVVGSFVFLLVFLTKVFRITRLIKGSEVVIKKDYRLVLLNGSTNAFSFFNYIFIGKDIPEDRKEKVIKHELVHCSQGHTVDLLFFELLRVVMWFNPMIYVYQNRVSLVHEYISDAEVSKETEKFKYIDNLLSDVFQVENISFINQFYKHSLIKKRIVMMTKKQSKKIKQLKYLLLVPILGSMLFYSSCSENQLGRTNSTKQIQKLYFGKVEYEETKNETYLDLAMSFNNEPLGKEVTLKELDANEEAEFLKFKTNFSKNKKGAEEKGNFYFKIYELNERKVVTIHMKGNYSRNPTDTDDVPFSRIDKAPTFPGCDEGDKACFNESMKNFVEKEFDMSLGNSLGLSAGKKRIYAVFKVDKTGEIVDLQVRAPHPDLKLHVLKMFEKLPKMVPGEEAGEVVRVGYTLPITLNITG
ncbi:Signal transducer regulating beta-lactamase production, contains metallopeptidase domain [Tenacibaculum sp. MAR_2009_124]|uniref:M56 family metallopeptidase n=1 Tax=Tenacibaculum sp. MAR_2009_124 TaxID=1250059 RepID=UPI000894D7C0|nr:M56 family metallopeptidase [Tenacibaculum sp. MAR_2009_124]SEB95464.1 Signal transducer regulating beta-lactamase production, contains metallopeptidase domain [Tenacibaculum sp. MAR_2009_124]